MVDVNFILSSFSLFLLLLEFFFCFSWEVNKKLFFQRGGKNKNQTDHTS